MSRHALIATVLLALVGIAATAPHLGDPWLWLEDIDGDKALAWVEEQNRRSTSVLEAVPEFEAIHQGILEVYDSQDRIPVPTVLGGQVYNFRQDAEHVRGIWRRGSLAEYLEQSPSWETVLDLDALAAAEGESWVWKEPVCLPPAGRRCMVALSRGGGDAVVYREFDTVSKRFVDGGFALPEAKTDVKWIDPSTLAVATDFGDGSLTTSGYPRIVKRWQRGTPLADAATVFEGDVEAVGARFISIHTPEGRYDLVHEMPAFFRGTYYAVLGERLVRLDLPEDAKLQEIYRDQLVISLRSDWAVGDTSYPQGALIAIDFDDFLQGRRHFEILFEPSERVSLREVARSRDHLIVTALDNVRGRMYRLQLEGGAWQREELELPGPGTAEIISASASDAAWFFGYTDFLAPSSLYLVDGAGAPTVAKRSPAWFDADGMRMVQYEATSADGTKVPYFMVTPEGFEAGGDSPTVLYGYGGFEVPMLPSYSGTIGTAWLERGGVFVLANIRGGGEFGPAWHQAALKQNRQRSFDDFVAVAEDLIARNITLPEHLGIMGGSNGGLLVGAVFVQQPELFDAVVCQAPLLDMRRYHRLLAGASWVAEYGDPDVPEEWEYLETWSPYHNVTSDGSYPEVLFHTTTRDDRVHPGHARKMVARMLEQGHQVYYFENTEGGHAAGATNAQRAYGWALDYAYLWSKLR